MVNVFVLRRTRRGSLERQEEVSTPYREAIRAELPRGMRQTFLLVGEEDTVAIATVWNSRARLLIRCSRPGRNRSPAVYCVRQAAIPW